MLWKKWLDVFRHARVPEARTAVAYFLEDLAKGEGLQQHQYQKDYKVGNHEVTVSTCRPSVQVARLLNDCKCVI